MEGEVSFINILVTTSFNGYTHLSQVERLHELVPTDACPTVLGTFI